MSGQSERAGAEKDTRNEGKDNAIGSGESISQQKGGDLAPDPAHKATENSGREVNRNRPDKPK